MPAEITMLRAIADSLLCIIYTTVRCALAAAVLMLCGLNAAMATQVTDESSGVAVALREALQSAAADEAEPPSAILEFYAARNFAPAWLDAQRQSELRHLPTLAHLHGLNPLDYALQQTAAAASQRQTIFDLAQRELAATHLIANLAMHLQRGKIDQTGVYPELNQERIAANPRTTKLLGGAAASASLFNYLHQQAPDTLLYRKMLSSLAAHRALEASGRQWPLLAAGRTLKPGMQDSRGPRLRQRFGLEPAATSATSYAADIAAAVAAFQTRHALQADGILGPRTVAALNVSVSRRIAQLRVNLDAQRWAAMPPATTYLLVNIAQYRLQLIEQGQAVWSMKTQVGRRARPTPVFKSHVESIVANPTWTVPPTIFREDVLPRVQSDPDYLVAHNMYPVDRSGHRVDASGIDWAQVSAENFPYRLRSGPYAGNALGRIKFQMPNPYLIYLHDTPSKHLFKSDVRATSSGCIRLEQPEQLAARLMHYQPPGQAARMTKALAADKTRYIGLAQSIPIIVMYGTVDLSDNNELVFAADVYRNDAVAVAALDTSSMDSAPARFANLNSGSLTATEPLLR